MVSSCSGKSEENAKSGRRSGLFCRTGTRLESRTLTLTQDRSCRHDDDVIRRFLLLAGALVGVLSGAAQAAKPFPDFILGADISWIPEQEAKGQRFYQQGVAQDIFTILKAHQFNWVRLRVFHNPKATNGYSAAGFCDLEHTRQMARRTQQAGFSFLLDFHYSDTWADPGHQAKPAAWRNLPLVELTRAVHDDTQSTIRSLIDQGTPPALVQVGNEISNGLLWPEGSLTNWNGLAALVKAGSAGVRDADRSIPVMLHLALGGQNAESRRFLEHLRKHHVEFDILGLSYYPKWHGTTNDLRANLNDLASRYPQPIIVVEYSEYKREVNDIVHGLVGGKGLGTFIWEPTKWGEALFDRQGHAKPALELYPEISKAYRQALPMDKREPAK